VDLQCLPPLEILAVASAATKKTTQKDIPISGTASTSVLTNFLRDHSRGCIRAIDSHDTKSDQLKRGEELYETIQELGTHLGIW